MKNERKEKDWKDGLLKSSLALEHCVTTLLEKHNVDSYGEFSYMRKNETGYSSEHSIDIDAIFAFDTPCYSQLNFLIECKYCHQSVKWFFCPISLGRKNYNLLEYGLVKVLEECCPGRIDQSGFVQFESKIALASKGIEIYANDKNEGAIKHGLYQLRYALPNKAVSIIEGQLNSIHDSDIAIEMLIPMLVTTAPLYILNRKADIGAIQKAGDIYDVAVEVDSLVVYQEPSVDLKKYADDLHKKIIVHPLFEASLRKLNSLLSERKKETYFPDMSDMNLHSKFRRLPAKILVVKLNALEKVIKKVLAVAKKAVGSYDKFAILKNDFAEHRSFFRTKTWFEKYERDEESTEHKTVL